MGSKKSAQTRSDDYLEYKVEATVISSNTHFEGKISSSGVMRVDGTIIGELDTKGHVIIGESGCVKEKIKANRITVSGIVEGSVACNGTLEMTQSGVLNADIEVGSLCIEDGAVFNGKCTTVKKISAE